MMDEAYKAKVTSAILKALFDASMTEQGGTRVVMMQSAEIVSVMTTTMALLLRDSEETATPSRTRRLCDEIARTLQRRINEAKLVPSPFETWPMGGAH